MHFTHVEETRERNEIAQAAAPQGVRRDGERLLPRRLYAAERSPVDDMLPRRSFPQAWTFFSLGSVFTEVNTLFSSAGMSKPPETHI
jgi:hypothetical protein